MELICRDMYRTFYAPKQYLTIQNYDETCHFPTYYNFRLGACGGGDDVHILAEPMQVGPGRSIIVWTHERFRLSERILGIFGQPSELFLLRGLVLHNSPFIDPGFDGLLQVMLQNTTDEPVALDPLTPIGKVAFFDIAHTPIGMSSQVTEAARLLLRREVAEMLDKQLRDSDIWVHKTIDTEAPKVSPTKPKGRKSGELG